MDFAISVEVLSSRASGILKNSLFNIVARDFSRGLCIVGRSFSQGLCMVARNFARELCIVARNLAGTLHCCSQLLACGALLIDPIDGVREYFGESVPLPLS